MTLPEFSPPLRLHQTRGWSFPWIGSLCSCTGPPVQTGIHTGLRYPRSGCDTALPAGPAGPPGCAAGSGSPSPLGLTNPGRVSRPAPEGKGRRRGRRCRRGGRHSAGRSWRGPAARGRSAPACCATRRNNRRSADLMGAETDGYQAPPAPEGGKLLKSPNNTCKNTHFNK